MDVSGALHEGLWLEYKDEMYFQAINYEQIHFHCKKCHEHGYLIREFPMNKLVEKSEEKKEEKSKEVFVQLNAR